MAVQQKIGAKHYLECSAKTGEGVREVFQYATRAALLSRPVSSPHTPVLVLTPPFPPLLLRRHASSTAR